MKAGVGFLTILFVAELARGDGFPIISVQPQNQNVSGGVDAVLNVITTGANGYQWRFNGADIPGGTGATLTVTNAQATDSGYYDAVVKNAFGWVPSQMAFVTVGGGGRVPFSNQGYSNAVATYQYGAFYPFGVPITNGTARVVAGPALDQMQPVGSSTPVPNGYFNAPAQSLPNIAVGQPVYYRVDVSYPVSGGTYTQPSRILKLTASSTFPPPPATSNLYFPVYLEWPTPVQAPISYSTQVCVLGETFTLTNFFNTYGDFGTPTWQWRKDGKLIGAPGNLTFYWGFWAGPATVTISNVQPSDAGIYDVVVLADNWFIGSKTMLSVQLTNGFGLFQFPRVDGTNFVADLTGAAGRRYMIQFSTDLSSWADLNVVSNITGTVTFTNSISSARNAFYRARLLP